MGHCTPLALATLIVTLHTELSSEYNNTNTSMQSSQKVHECVVSRSFYSTVRPLTLFVVRLDMSRKLCVMN